METIRRLMENSQWIVRHISVDPSHRGEGIGKEMIRQLSEMDLCGSIASDSLTEPFIQKCLTMLEEADNEY